jgi:chemotaxis protein methyltransferase CheR
MALTILRQGIAQPVTMSDQVFGLIRGYIYDLTGIYFQDNKKYLLEGRLSKRIKALNLASYDDYLQLIRYSPRRDDELKSFYEAITINETFFFRNVPQFDAFETAIIPEVMKGRSNGNSRIRVWSAASSSGEEAYSLSMLFQERIRPRNPRFDIEIVGTDINNSVLETARSGIYRDYAVRNMPKEYFDKYMTTRDGRFHVNDPIKKSVRFDALNLYDDAKMRMMRGFDVIFCCNVLIYFDAASKQRVVANLYDSLNTGGYLFIGYAESLHGISKAFKLVNFPKTVAYRKE